MRQAQADAGREIEEYKSKRDAKLKQQQPGVSENHLRLRVRLSKARIEHKYLHRRAYLYMLCSFLAGRRVE